MILKVITKIFNAFENITQFVSRFTCTSNMYIFVSTFTLWKETIMLISYPKMFQF